MYDTTWYQPILHDTTTAKRYGVVPSNSNSPFCLYYLMQLQHVSLTGHINEDTMVRASMRKSQNHTVIVETMKSVRIIYLQQTQEHKK